MVWMPELIDLRLLLDGARAAVIATDSDYRVRYLNAAAEERLRAPSREAVGQPISLWVPGDYDSPPHPTTGWRVQAVPGGWAFYGDGGPSVERLNQRMLEAEQLAAVGQLAASVAHEIGAPLTAITMAVEQLLKRECDACGFGERDLNIVLSQIHRISRLTRRLVELARPGIPALELIELNDVVRDTLDLLEKQLKRSGIKLELELAGEPCAVKGDRQQLQQALLNLMLNAERALRDCGGGRLLVRTRRMHSWIELQIADTGPGINPEDLPKVFLPFFSRSGGTGLGLSTVRQIIHGHGGTVEVESVPGQGAAFTVRLPEGTDD